MKHPEAYYQKDKQYTIDVGGDPDWVHGLAWIAGILFLIAAILIDFVAPTHLFNGILWLIAFGLAFGVSGFSEPASRIELTEQALKIDGASIPWRRVRIKQIVRRDGSLAFLTLKAGYAHFSVAPFAGVDALIDDMRDRVATNQTKVMSMRSYLGRLAIRIIIAMAIGALAYYIVISFW